MSEKDKPVASIIDFGMGNLFSVRRACEYAGLEARITSGKEEIANSDAVILPGVGAFGDAMDNLCRLDLIGPLKDLIAAGKPFMGICLGMQLLMSESEEFGCHKGLDILKGRVIKFPALGKDGRKIKIPQVGWNSIHKPSDKGVRDWSGSPLDGLDDGEFMYFVHSFHAVLEEKACVISVTSYEGIEYCSSLVRNNIFACQFHPERSAGKGLGIYGNFARFINDNSSRE